MIPGSGRTPGVGKGSPLQYSCLRNSTYRGAWLYSMESQSVSEHTFSPNVADRLNKLIRLRIVSAVCHCRVFVQSVSHARPYICFTSGNNRYDATKAPEQENPTKHNQYLSHHQPTSLCSTLIYGEAFNVLRTNPEPLNNGQLCQ